MSPPYIFRIDEIHEASDAPVTIDIRADWVPSTIPGANIRVGGGVSGNWWLCNGKQLAKFPEDQLPQNKEYYKAYSMFYGGGFGFWVMEGDATRPRRDASWQPLRFDHDPDDGYSSYLCNVAKSRTLNCRRSDQQWLQMLLPDIYFDTAPTTPYQQYGALKGELAIFLALVAFAMQPVQLPNVLPAMFLDGAWQTYQMPHGREDGRGVVVYVYTCPPGSRDDLRSYENGQYYNGKYYH